jgi:hypothetical protein
MKFLMEFDGSFVGLLSKYQRGKLCIVSGIYNGVDSVSRIPFYFDPR